MRDVTKYNPLNSLLPTQYSILIFTFCCFVVSGCDLFSTRPAEPPDAGRSNYQTPTSPDIVISNFLYAVNEKNTTNYISCFSDSSQTHDYQFSFIPSAGANALIFSNWNIESERRSFNSMVSSLQQSDYPSLDLTNKQSQPYQDSTVFIYDYLFAIKHNLQNIPTKFSGKLQLTIVNNKNGLWSISKWIDTKIENDSINDTWSIMKAQFYNL